MDNYCAPQWVDFTSSPQVPSDDYFEKYHEIYEPKLCTKIINQSTESTKEVSEIIETPKKSVQSENRYFIKSMSTENLQTEIDSLKNTPIKVIYPSPYNNSKQKIMKQVSYENILNEAMQNVQLCEDLCNDKKNTDVSSTEDIFKKPIPIKSKTAKPVKIREIDNNSVLVPTNKQMQDIARNILEEETKNVSLSSINMFKPDTSSSIKVMKDFSKTSKIDDHLKCNIPQNNNLKNDHSKIKLNNKHLKLKPSDLKQQSSMIKKCSTAKINTYNRPVVTLSQKDQDKSKLKQVEKNQSKTKFVRCNKSADSLALHDKITQKNIRVVKADTTVKVKQTQKPYSSFSKEEKTFCQKNSASKKMVTTIVGNTGSEIIIKKEKILFFDIPIHTKQKKITCPVPFSFEHRDKIKKQLKLDQSESKCNKSKSVPNLKLLDISHKIPSKLFDTRKKALMSSCSNKEINDKNKDSKQFEGNKKSSTAYIHSLPSNKIMKTINPMKSKIEKKKTQDGQNKKDTNQAKKSLASISCKNIQSNTNLKVKKQEIIQVNKKCIEKENRQPNINVSVTNNSTLKQSKDVKVKSTAFKTNVEEREKQRRVLEDKMKQKKVLQVEKLKKEKEEKEANEKLEIAKLRKQAEIKARPMPIYKPLIRVKSTKPLTKPQSPAWSSKRRVKSTL
ncbi:hypothetical protein HZH68_003361 [Vespula germanica]|uniref:TPX2 C-terminal domain-containing protein n=1 Tax=Vespula germanica TaxID=30212 RepID=A0A834NP24_VESGE|nr:hypothetical protein HZH68_003361 [Vespula germanica]